MPDITKIPAPRVPVFDPVTGAMTREWYRFFYNLFVLTGAGASDLTVLDLLKGPSVDAALTEVDKQLQAQEVAPAAAAPQELNAQLQELSVQPRAELGTLSAVNIDNVPYLGFGAPPPWAGANAGEFWFDPATGAFNAKMGNNNITQQVGEEFFRYGKATAPVSDTNLQAVYKTGTVGASGVITFAPTVAGITRADQILGIATESIAKNGFGRITLSGTVRGINTTGSVYGEVWADNDDIWYNPGTGGLTKTKPSAPNIKVLIGTVIKAGSGGSGSFFVNIGSSSELGGTDSNVQLGSLASGQFLIYDATAGYWKNAQITPGANISVTNGAGAVTIAVTGLGSMAFENIGASGSFTAASGETVTVVNGVITSIV